MASKTSKFDIVYRSLLLSNFFSKGWGKPEDMKRIFELRRKLGRRETAVNYVNRNHPITITKDVIKSDHRRLEGYFTTPFVEYLPTLLPPESEKAHFQAILPLKAPSQGLLNPVCSKNSHFLLDERLMALFCCCSPLCWYRRPSLLEAQTFDGSSSSKRKGYVVVEGCRRFLYDLLYDFQRYFIYHLGESILRRAEA